ncbi:MAG: HAMP domain-containing histidine kinase [Leadbetterella sp.]|nr:HAMP domain-containing histidine kinase [Leadbetterella sp.]
MKIRNKILLYFSLTVIGLTLVSFVVIYYLFSEYREEEFQQQQLEKITSTVRLVNQYKKKSEQLSLLLDEQDIHDFYDEKLLIYDQDKHLIFSSIDNLKIRRADLILQELSPNVHWIETKGGDYDIVGAYLEFEGKAYYAISKAFDSEGYSKRDFLGKLLTGMFVAFTLVVWLISRHLSNIISRPIVALSEKLSKLVVEDSSKIEISTTTSELKNLTEKFNALLDRTRESFVFQKHTIHHISHELKTPIAILVSELEKLQKEEDMDRIKRQITRQTDSAKSLGNIINVLLEISKIDSGQQVAKKPMRVDELLFDIIGELNRIHPGYIFEVNYPTVSFDENQLYISANRLLIKQAFQNLLLNGVTYSDDGKVEVLIEFPAPQQIRISFTNRGMTLSAEETRLLFSHFFRGANSRDKSGFGLGLVLTHRIFKLHSATIHYETPAEEVNRFVVDIF